MASALVLDLRGQPVAILKRNKAAHHAWGMFTSPLLTALLSASEQVAIVAGISRNALRQRIDVYKRQNKNRGPPNPAWSKNRRSRSAR